VASDARQVRNRVLEMARKDERRGDWRSALRRYRRLTGLDPDDAALHVKLGDVCLRLRQPEDAADAFWAAGRIFSRTAFDEKAAALYKRALQLAPDRARVREALIEAYERLGRARDAVGVLGDAAEAMERSGRRREALDLRRQMARLDPLDVEPRLGLARELEADGRSEEALHEYVESAVELLRQERFERAQGVFSAILALRPGLPDGEVSGGASGDAGGADTVDGWVVRATEARTHFRALASLYRQAALLHHRAVGREGSGAP